MTRARFAALVNDNHSVEQQMTTVPAGSLPSDFDPVFGAYSPDRRIFSRRVDLDENGNGDLDVQIQRSVAAGNARWAVFADQATSGAGSLRIQSLLAEGNTLGEVRINAGITLERIPGGA